MYFLKCLSIFIEKKAWNDVLKMPVNNLPDANLNLPEMKTKSPSCPSGGVHMYDIITNVCRICPYHFHNCHCSNGFSNDTLREKVPLVSVKSTFSLLFWHEILIPNFKCYCHEGLCMSLHTLNLLGEKYLNESHWPMGQIRLLECTII